MKIGINKSAKRVMSLAIAFAMFVGTLFVANVGVVSVQASTQDDTNLKISYWDGKFETNSAGFNVTDASILNETGATGTSAADPIIIDNAKELATLVRWSNYKSTAGYFFKLSDAYDAYILQSESIVDAKELMGLSSGAETKAYFEDTKLAGKLFDWGQCCTNGSFAGSFDGNGVEIYGLYVNPVVSGSDYARQNVGLFGCIDPGVLGAAQTGSGGVKTYNDNGNFFKNVIVKNSYYYGSRRMGGIAANSNGPNYGCSTNGIVYFDSCVVANSYMYCTGDHDGKMLNTAGNNGVITGYPDGSDTFFVQNCLAYGNETYNELSKSAFAIMGNINTYTNAAGVATTGKIKNCIAIGTNPVVWSYSGSANYVENNVKLFDVETLRGAAAMAWADGLAWGTDWFAVEGEYPTPIKPASFIPASAKPDNKFSAGNGTKESPYIIRSVDQLFAMVNEPSYSDSYEEKATHYKKDGDNWVSEEKSVTSYVSKYYKVADDVDALYINNVKTQEEVKALAEEGAGNKWAPSQAVFAGNFDGNGATIYGMISTTGKGFINKLDGTNAAVKNVHFQAAYVKGSGVAAAVVTTDFGIYGYGYKPEPSDSAATIWFNRVVHPTTGETVNQWVIANVGVTESYVQSTYTGSNGGATAGGIVALSTTPAWLTVQNCMFDGNSSTLIDGTGTTAGANPDSMKAGIVSMTASGSTNRWDIANCISINEYPVSMKSGATYTRFDATSGGGTCEIKNMYGPVNSNIDLTKYPKFGVIKALETKANYSPSDAPLLDWASTWEIVEGEDGNKIPLPTGTASDDTSASYSQLIAAYKDNTGAYDGNGVSGLRGQYGWQLELAGSGTESDPYLINNALQLAQAIGCGGKYIDHKYYYKLTADIDVGGKTWIDQESINNNYVYVPFEGVLDGAGHTITGLSAVDEAAAGLVPVLNGGTIKNVHIRDSYAGSNEKAGLIAGEVKSGNIIGCSVEGCVVGAPTTNFMTGDAATITDSYYVANGEQTFSSDINKNNITLYPAAGAKWYKGTDGIYRHVSFAMANPVTDVDGDGVVEEFYGASDIVALRNHLLGRTGFENIFGDVSRNGVVNISDLAILRRKMSDDFNGVTDGFWRNLELGNVAIYYAENDTYDMARKLELYFEALNPKIDVIKYAGSAVTDTSVIAKANYNNQPNAVVITQGTPAADNYDDYSISFNKSTNVLTIYGGSFTAVEQAVKEFIENADPKSESGVYTTNGTKSILSLTDTSKDASSTNNHYLSYKVIEDMDGNKHTVYYAWGDEFEGTGSFDTDQWEIRNYRNEGSLNGLAPTDADTGDTRYLHLEGATVESIPDLWVVNNGKLTIWRGVNVGDGYSVTTTAGFDRGTVNAYKDPSIYSWGYKTVNQNAGETNTFGREIDAQDIFVDPGLIQTSSTMIFKQGYSEMRAALPNDGHAFPAWWFMSGVGQKNTKTFENTYLFSKVYKINSRWDGVTMSTDPTDLSTYKYEMPQAFLEYDIVEFMQAQDATTGSGSSKKGVTTGNYRDFIQLTVHKYYNQHVKDGMLYVPDWSTGGYVSGYNGISQTDFNTTSSKGDGSTFIHRYNPDKTTSAHPYTVVEDYWLWQDETQTSASYSIAQALKNNAGLSSSAKVSDIYTYGFWWSVNEAAGTYDLIVYVDFNNDGNMSKSEMIFHMNETNGHEYNDPTWGKTSASKGSDAAVWNQYAYMLIDNAFYTSNPHGKGSSSSTEVGVTLYTDLLTQESGDKTTFDLEYVRVYQEDGRRDIVTNETEAFNTGNRYGY